MKILILGAGGLLGFAMAQVLGDDHEVSALTRAECDIQDAGSVEKALAQFQPDIVINTAAYTQVDAAETNDTDSFTVNAEAVGKIAKLVKERGITLVHFSSDYVFDGSNVAGYAEDSVTNPINVYGKSKELGEKAVRESGCNSYIVRSSWLYGPGGGNFVDTMLRMSEQGISPLTVVNDQTGCPTYTFDLAQAVSALLKTSKYGTYHLVNNGATTWYGFALEIFQQLGVPYAINPITSGQLNKPARRPEHSVLLNTKHPLLRNWQEALTEYLFHKTIIL